MITSLKGFEVPPISQEPTNPDLAKDQTETREQDPNVREFSRRAIVAFFTNTIGSQEDYAAHNKVFSFMASDIYEKLGHQFDQVAATPYSDKVVYALCRAYIAAQHPLLLNRGQPQPGCNTEQWLDQAARLVARGNPDQGLKVRRFPAEIYAQLVNLVDYQ